MGHRALVAYRRADDDYRVHYAHWGGDLGRRIGPERPLGGPATEGTERLRAALDRLDVDPAGGRLADADGLGADVEDRPTDADGHSTDGDGHPTDADGHSTDADGHATAVDPDPLAVAVGPADVLATVDATVEYLVVVTPAYETTTLVACPVSFPGIGPGAAAGEERPDSGEGSPAAADGTATEDDDAIPAWPHEPDLALVDPDDDPAVVRDRFVAVRSGLWAAVEDGAVPPDDVAAVLRSALGEFGTVFDADDPAVLDAA